MARLPVGGVSAGLSRRFPAGFPPVSRDHSGLGSRAKKNDLFHYTPL
jgi:hypothetical protein